MSETIDAVFDHGVFKPCEPVSIPNGQRVTLTYAVALAPEKAPTWPDLPPELFRNSDGVIVARGTRITLFLLLEFHFQGTPWSKMQEDFPTVSPADWQGIEAYVRHNEPALRIHFEEQNRNAESLRKPTPPGLTLEALRERFEKKYGSPYPQS